MLRSDSPQGQKSFLEGEGHMYVYCHMYIYIWLLYMYMYIYIYYYIYIFIYICLSIVHSIHLLRWLIPSFLCYNPAVGEVALIHYWGELNTNDLWDEAPEKWSDCWFMGLICHWGRTWSLLLANLRYFEWIYDNSQSPELLQIWIVMVDISAVLRNQTNQRRSAQIAKLGMGMVKKWRFPEMEVHHGTWYIHFNGSFHCTPSSYWDTPKTPTVCL